MRTIVRFALYGARGYREAFDLLARAGFRPCTSPFPGGTEDEVLPGAVVADIVQDPAIVSRAIFLALDAAGLGPVAVTGCHEGAGARRCGARALAPR